MVMMPEVTFVTNEIVSHMGCIVNTEAHGDDQVDAGHHVYGQAPEVNKSSNIDLQNIDKSSSSIRWSLFTRVSTTQTRTMMQAGMFWMRITVVMNTQRSEMSMLRQNSVSIT